MSEPAKTVSGLAQKKSDQTTKAAPASDLTPKYTLYHSTIKNLKLGKYQFVKGRCRVPVDETPAFDANLARFNSRITSRVTKVTLEAEMAKLRRQFLDVEDGEMGDATKGIDSATFKRAEQLAQKMSPAVSQNPIGQPFDPVADNDAPAPRGTFDPSKFGLE